VKWTKSSHCSDGSCVEVDVSCDAGSCVEVDNETFITPFPEPACDTGSCVEVAFNGEFWHVRNSNDPGTVLTYTQAEWDAFILGALDGEFNL